jgi:tetratricopeptide (TPR) repeat protein
MTLVGQPPKSPALQQGYDLLAQGKPREAEEIVRRAALEAKKQHGSGSHPLALAYADMARIHMRTGELERAAKEFQHAAHGPLPSDPQHRRDRLAFLFGFGAALGELNRLAEAEKVLRQCLAFARNIGGPQSAIAAVALVPLADVLLRAGKTAEAAKIANSAYDALWQLGDPLFTETVGTRAEALKATGKTDNPFSDLTDLPEEMVSAAVANTLTRAGKGDTGRVRAVLADVLGFVDKKFGDGHAITCDTLAAVAYHEAAAGDKADEKVRKNAVRRSVWSFAVRRVPGGLLANLEVGFEPGGAIHLAPHLTRDPNPSESAQLETILNQAVDDLYARPAVRP